MLIKERKRDGMGALDEHAKERGGSSNQDTVYKPPNGWTMDLQMEGMRQSEQEQKMVLPTMKDGCTKRKWHP